MSYSLFASYKEASRRPGFDWLYMYMDYVKQLQSVVPEIAPQSLQSFMIYLPYHP